MPEAAAPTGPNGRHLVSGRALRDHPRSAAVPLASGGPGRRCHRHPRAATTRSPRRCAVLPEAVERARPWTAASDHRQARQLCGGAPGRDAGDDPQYPAVRKQSSGGLAPAHAATRATDAPVQVCRARATIPVGAWCRVESVSCRSSPPASCSPSPAAHPCLRGLAGGDVCLKRRSELSSHRRWSSCVQRQLDSAHGHGRRYGPGTYCGRQLVLLGGPPAGHRSLAPSASDVGIIQRGSLGSSVYSSFGA